MPTKVEHLCLASRNHQVIQHLLSSKEFFSEWLTTIAFYEALHTVDALLAHDSDKHLIGIFDFHIEHFEIDT